MKGWLKMNATLRREILTETYEDMQKLICEAAWKFWRAYGGDIDDLIGQANLIFIKAVDSHDASQSKLTTWICFCIKNGLLDYMREQYRPAHIEINESMNSRHEQFSVIELLDEMERDAITILQLFLDTPQEILLDALSGGEKGLASVRQCMKRRMRNRLRQMGWTIERITESFNEIRNIISY